MFQFGICDWKQNKAFLFFKYQNHINSHLSSDQSLRTKQWEKNTCSSNIVASPPPLKAGSVKHRRLQGSAHQKQEAKKKVHSP